MAYVLAVGSIPYHKYPYKKFSDIAVDVLRNVQEDITEVNENTNILNDIEEIFFGNCAMDRFGQSNIRGQVVLQAAVDQGILPKGISITNLEAGCATGGVTFLQACRSIDSGDCQVALAIGVEKLIFPDDPKMLKSVPIFTSGIAQEEQERWMSFYQQQAQDNDLSFEPHPYRVIFLDIHAMQAQKIIKEQVISKEHIAHTAVKNHNNGKANPNAQYRFGATFQSVLEDRPIVEPFTRSMCAPVSDGGSAVILCSQTYKETLPMELQKRCIRVDSVVSSGGRYRDVYEEGVTQRAAQLCFQRSKFEVSDIDIAEVHDSTAFCELKAILDIGISTKESLSQDLEKGRFLPSGTLPINVSGGLISKGHPLGATGLGMVVELTKQLRGESEGIQIDPLPNVALFHNAGGMIGFDEAVAVVGILERVL